MKSDKRVPSVNQMPAHKGYQPAPSKVTGGHQPKTSESRPSTLQPPPKKP